MWCASTSCNSCDAQAFLAGAGALGLLQGGLLLGLAAAFRRDVRPPHPHHLAERRQHQQPRRDAARIRQVGKLVVADQRTQPAHRQVPHEEYRVRDGPVARGHRGEQRHDERQEHRSGRVLADRVDERRQERGDQHLDRVAAAYQEQQRADHDQHDRQRVEVAQPRFVALVVRGGEGAADLERAEDERDEHVAWDAAERCGQGRAEQRRGRRLGTGAGGGGDHRFRVGRPYRPKRPLTGDVAASPGGAAGRAALLPGE